MIARARFQPFRVLVLVLFIVFGTGLIDLQPALAVAPRVTGFFVPFPAADGTFTVGTTVVIGLTFDQDVTLTGTPQLILNTGSPATTTINLTRFNSPRTFLFNYAITAGNSSPDLSYVNSSSLVCVSPCVIRNAGNELANLQLPAPGTAGSLSAVRNIVIDAVAPSQPSIDFDAADDTGSSTTDNITNKTSGLTFSGRAEANSTVRLLEGSTVLGTTTALANNTWSIDPVSLAAGVHPVRVTSTDAVGNVSVASTIISLTVDTTRPTVTINKTAAQADPTGTQPIGFTTTFTETVTGFIGTDVTTSASTAPGTKTINITGGQATYTASVSGATGTGTIVASIAAGVASDTAGNLNLASTSTDNSVQFNAPPPPPPPAPAPPTVLSITRIDPSPTSASTVSWSVRFSEPVLNVDATDFHLSPISLTGSGNIRLLTQGSGLAVYTVAADTGTVAAPGPGTLRLDLLDNDSITSAANSISLGGPGAGNASLKGEEYTISAAAPVPPDLLNTIISSAVANTEPPTNGVFINTSGTPTSTTLRNVRVTFDSNKAGSDTFACKIDAEQFAPCTSQFTRSGLSVGSHTFSVQASLGAETDASPASFSWTITAAATDSTPAVLTFNTPGSGAVVNGTVSVSISATDASMPVSVALAVPCGSVSGANPQSVGAAGAATFSWNTLGGTACVNGNRILSAIGRDSASPANTSAAVTRTVNVNNVAQVAPPPIPNTTDTDGDGVLDVNDGAANDPCVPNASSPACPPPPAGGTITLFSNPGSGAGTASVCVQTGAGPSSVNIPSTGFVSAPLFCPATGSNPFGSSATCGDGVKGPFEVCEIGEVKTDTASCNAPVCTRGGIRNFFCIKDLNNGACRFQTVSDSNLASCVPFSCGNGAVDPGEACDDGILNGTQGHCGPDCSFASAFFCGDGFLGGGEQCDCGNSDANRTKPNSFALLRSCSKVNGQYTTGTGISCDFDCTAPGPSCGDAIVNGPEACDPAVPGGGFEEYGGAFCLGGANNGQKCSIAGNCPGGSCGGNAATNACVPSKICTAGGTNEIGNSCSTNTQCDGIVSISVCDESSCDAQQGIISGICSVQAFSTTRSRTCNARGSTDQCTFIKANTFNGFGACKGGSQRCGNGAKEGTEQCDDGNTKEEDACTNSCLTNVCGDGKVNRDANSTESCDDGANNGRQPGSGEIPYNGTAVFCTADCKFRTISGPFCGDNVKNLPQESCDGAQVNKTYCYNATTREGGKVACTPPNSAAFIAAATASAQAAVTAAAASANPTQANIAAAAAAQSALTAASVGVFMTGSSPTTCGSPATCTTVGVCDGGVSSGLVCRMGTAADCTGGTCKPPQCTADCNGSCPFDFDQISLKVQSEIPGSLRKDDISLFSFQNANGDVPDNATLFIPACAVGRSLQVDIARPNVVLPTVDVMIMIDTSGSMVSSVGGGLRRIDVVVDAVKPMIETLISTYQQQGGTMRIAVGSFELSSEHRAAHGANASIDQEFTSSIQPLQDMIETYRAIDNNGGTPTEAGLQVSLDVFKPETSTAQRKILVFMSDGAPSDAAAIAGCTTNLSDLAKVGTVELARVTNYNTGCGGFIVLSDVVGIKTAAAQNIEIYTATVAPVSDAPLINFMRHISDDGCPASHYANPTANSSPAFSDVTGCTVNPQNNIQYAYSGITAVAIEEMFLSISNSILGVTPSFVQSGTGGAVVSSFPVLIGDGTVLPIPDFFVCGPTEQSIPLSVSFSGTGSLDFEDFSLEYCPIQ